MAMEKDRVLRIWDLVDQNLTLDVIEVRMGIHKRSGQRYKTVLKGFESRRPIADIVRVTGLTESWVLQMHRWWEQSQGKGRQPSGSRGFAEDALYLAAVMQHDKDLGRAMGLFKEYLEQVVGETPSAWLQPWCPPPMDAIRLKDLFSHLAEPKLDQAFQQATSEGPSDRRRNAGRLALQLLREVLATRQILGSCGHCPQNS